MYMCILSHTFYCCYKLCMYARLLQFCGVCLFILFSFFNLIFKPIFFTYIILFVFLTLLFPLLIKFNVYKFSFSTYILLGISILSFFPFLSTDLLVFFSLLYSPLLYSPCFSFVFQFVL